jgi:hypothetical protein
MPSDIGTALTAVIALLALLGMAVRFVLLPYLRDNLVRPVDEVHKQVTENHHRNDEPTLPDRIEDVHDEVRALSQVLNGHLESGERWMELYDRELELVKERQQLVERQLEDRKGST